MHHPRVNTVNQNLIRMYKLCSPPADWRRLPVDVPQLLLAMDHSAELFPKVKRPTGFTVCVKNKTQTWQFIDRDREFFCIKACRRARRHSAGNGADDYVWRNNIDFFITTMWFESQGNRCSKLWKALISKYSGAPPRTPLGGSHPPRPPAGFCEPLPKCLCVRPWNRSGEIVTDLSFFLTVWERETWFSFMDNMIICMFGLQQSDQEAMCSKPTDQPDPAAWIWFSVHCLLRRPGLIRPFEWPVLPSVGTLGRSPSTTEWHVWSACSPDQLRETCSCTCSVGFRSVMIHVEQ